MAEDLLLLVEMLVAAVVGTPLRVKNKVDPKLFDDTAVLCILSADYTADHDRHMCKVQNVHWELGPSV